MVNDVNHSGSPKKKIRRKQTLVFIMAFFSELAIDTHEKCTRSRGCVPELRQSFPLRVVLLISGRDFLQVLYGTTRKPRFSIIWQNISNIFFSHINNYLFKYDYRRFFYYYTGMELYLLYTTQSVQLFYRNSIEKKFVKYLSNSKSYLSS